MLTTFFPSSHLLYPQSWWLAFFLLKFQGLADAFILLRYPFESAEAIELNKKIFETIYFGALTVSWTHLVLSSNKRQYVTEREMPSLDLGLCEFHKSYF